MFQICDNIREYKNGDYELYSEVYHYVVFENNKIETARLVKKPKIEVVDKSTQPDLFDPENVVKIDKESWFEMQFTEKDLQKIKYIIRVSLIYPVYDINENKGELKYVSIIYPTYTKYVTENAIKYKTGKTINELLNNENINILLEVLL